MNSSATRADPPFVADGGVDVPIRRDEDPYRSLDDLMAVVEALCPVWPRRETMAPARRMLL
jgi:hypothetical protein